MWFLSFIPDSILLLFIFSVIGAGVGLYFLGMFFNFVPTLIPHKEPIRILATLLIIAGVYFYGSYDTEMTWRKRVEEVQAKVAEAEKASDTANKKLVAKSKEKQKVRVEYYATVHERIKEVEKQIDAKCELDPAVPKLHNQAAANPAGKVNIGDVKQ